jgi:hypothetical protein
MVKRFTCASEVCLRRGNEDDADVEEGHEDHAGRSKSVDHQPPISFACHMPGCNKDKCHKCLRCYNKFCDEHMSLDDHCVDCIRFTSGSSSSHAPNDPIASSSSTSIPSCVVETRAFDLYSMFSIH